MSSIIQAQQLYTAGIPLLKAYLLSMANNRTRNERLSAASHVVQIHAHTRFPRSKKNKWPTYHVAVAVQTGNALASQRSIFREHTYTHRRSNVTLAVHARRGLITFNSNNVEDNRRLYEGKDAFLWLPTSFSKSVRYEVLSFACLTVNKARYLQGGVATPLVC